MGPKKYRHKHNHSLVEAIQADPSEQTRTIEQFCPMLHWNHHNGLVFLQDDSIVQKYPDEPLFYIGSPLARHNQEGKVYDWIIKEGNAYGVSTSEKFIDEYTII